MERERYRKIERGRERGGSKHGKARVEHASKGDRASGDRQKQRQRQRKRQRLSVERWSRGRGSRAEPFKGGNVELIALKTTENVP